MYFQRKREIQSLKLDSSLEIFWRLSFLESHHSGLSSFTRLPHSHSVRHSLDLHLVRWCLALGGVQAAVGLKIIISQAFISRSSVHTSQTLQISPIIAFSSLFFYQCYVLPSFFLSPFINSVNISKEIFCFQSC